MVSPKLERILLVEDEVDIQMVAQLALEDVGGFRVEVCASGAEALERAPAFDPQLVLLDFMMPGMDGTKTMTALRRIPSLVRVPMVFLTARAQLSEVAEYRRQGAVEVIVKPFDPMSLSAQVVEVWEAFHEDSGPKRRRRAAADEAEAPPVQGEGPRIS